MKIKYNTDVKKFRDKYNLTQQELSDLTGIHIPNISNLENGRLHLYPKWKKELNKIADKLERGSENEN